MVTCKLFGGLGNQLFIMAATISYSMKHKMDYVLPASTTNPRWKSYRFKNLKYGDVDTTGFLHYHEPAINYNQRPYDICYKEIPYHENILLNGHFLSHKFFEQHYEKIIDLLDFKWKYEPGTIAVHTRRGDYKNMQEYLPVLPLEYYQKAVAFAVDKTGIQDLLVFGDDHQHNQYYFTKELFPFVENINFSEGKNEIEDLELMSGCPVLCSSNSTYSQWSHYLNHHRYKMLIAPKNYYGPAYGEVNQCDLWPPGTHLV